MCMFVQIVVKDLQNEVTKTLTSPLAGANDIFYAGTGALLLRSDDAVALFDLQQVTMLLPMHPAVAVFCDLIALFRQTWHRKCAWLKRLCRVCGTLFGLRTTNMWPLFPSTVSFSFFCMLFS